MQATNEIVVNVPEIEPRLKHATIFEVFDGLKPGESMIIHNDHDPKPLYFQLLGQRGDIFSWIYLQRGPEWWDIRITRNAESEEPVETTYTNTAGDIVINIPAIEPRYKHATIFQVFDTLKPGKSLIIHNDHDPKPVYYQLINERGDIFTWEYLQQGPEWWDIKVTIRAEEDEETIGQIIVKDLGKSEVFKKYGIDFCCGGDKTVRQACEEKGIDPAVIEEELRKSTHSVTNANNNFDDWNLDFLSDYIVNIHHNYVRKYMPEILKYSAKVTQVHGDHHPELDEINELVKQVGQEMAEHMVEEEGELFPWIKRIVQAQNHGGYQEPKRLAPLVSQLVAEHKSVGRAMEKIRELSQDYAIPGDACTSYKLLYKMLEEFENDLFIHIHLENNILFPKAGEIETTLV